MNGWRSRLMLVLAFVAAIWTHTKLASHLPNTPEGMLAVHGSAALFDFALLCYVPWLLSGSLCDDMELLCLVSIIANCAGWFAYMAYASPAWYNGFMLWLSIVQFFRLLLVDGDDATALGRGVVRRPDSRCA